MANQEQTACPGCHVMLPAIDGPTHAYMESSPACFAHFTAILAHEYSDERLLQTHRLTVDTFAVQHPGRAGSRPQIQSVGLHLARLCMQLDRPLPPKETNDVMLGLSRHKHTLELLELPRSFAITAANVSPYAGTSDHGARVIAWATATWHDWSKYHDYIREWIARWI